MLNGQYTCRTWGKILYLKWPEDSGFISHRKSEQIQDQTQDNRAISSGLVDIYDFP